MSALTGVMRQWQPN